LDVGLSVSERTYTRDDATGLLSDDFAPYCAYDAHAPDGVVNVHIDHTGTLRIELVANTPDFVPVLDVRDLARAGTLTCDDAATTVACVVGSTTAERDGGAAPDAGATTSLVTAKFTLAVDAGQNLAVIVDGATSTPGEFTLSLDLLDGACGDGVVNTALGETCDDGGTKDGDGCDHDCKREIPPNDTCIRATPLGASLAPGDSQSTSGTTAGALDDYTAPCAQQSAGPDRVYSFVTSTGGTFDATLTADFDGVLSMWARCDSSSQLTGVLACSDGPLATDPESITEDIPPGTYYLVVDGYGPQSYGTYSLSIGLK
jgi:cysteine-rich repeat protein